MKGIWKFLISLSVSLCAVSAIMLANGTFQTVLEMGEIVTDKQMQTLFRHVNDAFFITAFFFTCLGLLVILRKYLKRSGMFSFFTERIKAIAKKIKAI